MKRPKPVKIGVDRSLINAVVFPKMFFLTIMISPSVSIPFRYVKYWFYADSSIDSIGWNLTLEPNTPYTTSAAPVPLGASLFLDNSDFTKLSTDNTSGVFIGFNANADVDDNSIFLRVAI